MVTSCRRRRGRAKHELRGTRGDRAVVRGLRRRRLRRLAVRGLDEPHRLHRRRLRHGARRRRREECLRRHHRLPVVRRRRAAQAEVVPPPPGHVHERHRLRVVRRRQGRGRRARALRDVTLTAFSPSVVSATARARHRPSRRRRAAARREVRLDVTVSYDRSQVHEPYSPLSHGFRAMCAATALGGGNSTAAASCTVVRIPSPNDLSWFQ